jgi:FtsP/CotA-like multicopper oxidase with cupredoxin domain
MIQIGNEGGFIPSATVLPNTPVGYEYFRRTITVLNVTNHTLLLGPAERADVIVDFSGVPDGSKLIMYNDAPAPMPGFDSRLDYYTGDPDQTTSGGAPSTLPGYGPNTRTVMQFQVSSAIASQTPFNVGALQTGLQAAYAATQDKPIVPEAAYGPAFGTTYSNNYAHVVDATMTFTPIGSAAPATFFFQEKAIVEGFDAMFGRMNANLGGNLPNISGPQIGTAVPYDYVDPPTDITTNTIPGTQIGALADGTQIWRIDHQGVDTHLIHFHLMNVQVIERLAIDGQLFPPDANELGWKETIRMNPGQDVFIAIRPQAPTLPFKLPDSVRLIDPTLPEGATFTDSQGTAYTNSMTNFGWEYVWHCHILGHEENDMMRPFVFEVSPAAPTVLTAVPSPGPVKVTLHWTNNDTIPTATNLYVQRATNAAFTNGLTAFTVNGRPTSYVDTAVAGNTLYYYRVRAETAVGYSDWTNVVNVTTPSTAAGGLLARTNLQVIAPTRTSLPVTWTNPVGGLTPTSLRVQLSTGGAGGPWFTVVTLPGNTATSYTITGLRRNTSYWVRIVAVNGGNSQPSAALATRTLQ